MTSIDTAKGKKAFGTRDRVVGWLASHGDLLDESGMASTVLASAVGYPGSSIAFAQLLSGMQRAGLIEREVRGKRTYRIALTNGGRSRATSGASASGPSTRPSGNRSTSTRSSRPVTGPSRPQTLYRRPDPATARAAAHDELAAAVDSPTRQAPAIVEAAGGAGDVLDATDSTVDYDQLARRLLVQVARRLSLPTDTAERPTTGGPLAAGEPSKPWEQRRLTTLERQVAQLQKDLAQQKAARRSLEDENQQLRQDLQRTRDNLDRVQAGGLRPGRAPAHAPELDRSEIALLQRLLVERDAKSDRRHTESA